MDEQRKIVTQSPENSETPMDAVCSWVTPTRLFFVRNHFDVPQVDADAWRLSFGGWVDDPIELSLNELHDMPQHTVFSTIECAGNGRSYLQEKQHGVQWGAGAIAHAEWTGVPLHVLLEKVGLHDEVIELVFEGMDEGVEEGMSEPIHFARAMPLHKALHPDTLVALRMNGEQLTAEHGFPARLLVPGWYGVASVKWLSRVTASKVPFDGYYQTKKYTIKAPSTAGMEKLAVQAMAVKSEIIRPASGEELGVGTHRIFGVAWAGEDAVAKVEVCVENGGEWREARLMGLQAPYSWTMWEYIWEVAEPGRYDIRARATSNSGVTQPEEHDTLRGGYMINFVRPRRVAVQSRAAESVPSGVTEADVLLYDMNAFAEANAATRLDVYYEFSEGGGI